MNLKQLPFDTEQMIAGLRLWVETESPGFDAVSVNKIIDLATYDLASLGATIERIPGRFGYGDILRATINGGLNTHAGVLICCHADTVHPLGSLQAMPYRREGNKLFGAGVLSAKSGIVISLEAIRQLVRSGQLTQLPITFLIVPDKETGCPSSREFIEATARQAKYALVPEPAATNGGLILGRHAIARYGIDVKVDTVQSKPSARNGGEGSPIYDMARHIIDIEDMSTDECSFTIGSIQSGQWVNYAEKCTAEVISVAKSAKAFADSSRQMLALNSSNPDIGLHVSKGVTLPLWEPDATCRKLYDLACEVGKELNVDISASAAGNGSLGNITGALGIATLDGLGARGLSVSGKRAEYLDLDSLVERGRLMAGLLSKLS